MQTEKTSPGPMLAELGYIEESDAAIALDISTPTLIGYRKNGIGPDFSIVGRTVFYSLDNLKKWLEAGGTRLADAVLAPEPAPVAPRKPRSAKAAPRKRLVAEARAR